jgi:hypothetical protein
MVIKVLLSSKLPTDRFKNLIAALGFIPLSIICSACAPGFIYTDITEPLVTNMRDTQYSATRGKGYSLEFKEPLTIVGLRTQIASQAIGDVAKNEGLSKIAYADIRTKSILGGIWSKKTLLVYGTPADKIEDQTKNTAQDH